MTSIERHLRAKTAPVAPQSGKKKAGSQITNGGPSQVKYEQYKPSDDYAPYKGQTNGIAKSADEQAKYQSGGDLGISTHHEMPYAPTAPYPFLGPSSTYTPTQSPYAPTAYTGGEAVSQQATAPTTSGYIQYSNLSSSTDAVYQALMPVNCGLGPQMSWRNWAGSMAGNMPANASPQEYLNSANALMQLGNPQGGTSEVPNAQWPLMIFDGSQAGI